MKFRCDRCGKRYASTDEPVVGRVYRIRCRCGHVLVLRPWDAAATAAATANPAARARSVVALTAKPPGAASAVPPPLPDAAPPRKAAPAAVAQPGRFESLAPPLPAADLAEELPPDEAGLPELTPEDPVAPPIPAEAWATAFAADAAPVRDDPFARFAAALPDDRSDDPFAALAPLRVTPPPDAPTASGRVDAPTPSIAFARTEEVGSGDLVATRDPDAADEDSGEASLQLSTSAELEAPSDTESRRRGGIGRVAAGGAVVAIAFGAIAFWTLRPIAVETPIAIQAAMSNATSTSTPSPQPSPPLRGGEGAGSSATPTSTSTSTPTATPTATRTPTLTPTRSVHRDREPRVADRRRPAGSAGSASDVVFESAPAPPAPNAKAPAVAVLDPKLAEALARKPDPVAAAKAIDPAEVQAGIAKARPALDACVAEALAGPGAVSLAGRRTGLLLLVAPTGRAESALEDTDLDAAPVGTCLKRVAGKLSFRAFQGEPLAVRIPIVLGRSADAAAR